MQMNLIVSFFCILKSLIPEYVNDEDDSDSSSEDLSTSTLRYMNKTPLSVNSAPSVLQKLSKALNFTKNDYFVAVCLLIFFGVVFLLVACIGFYCMCRNVRNNRTKLRKKQALDSLNVKNYRELELMNSSNSNSNISSGNSGTVETDRDEEMPHEIHNLLDAAEHATHPNRLSNSFKLTDQSIQSADSVVSNLIFPRDSSTTVSSICHSSNSSQAGESARLG